MSNNKVSNRRVLYQASTNIQQLVKLGKPGIKSVPHRWDDTLKFLEQFVPKFKVTQVLWKLPLEGWWKCNSDGATRCNPNRISYAFCVKNAIGDLVFARNKEMKDATNIELEAMTLLEAVKYCLSQHMYSFILETDSLLMKNILDRKWRPPWNIIFVVEGLLDIMTMLKLKFCIL
ncbi:hypothetical protein K7X08_026298 [Anisodus acutangulus]|uniref:RNase H type-1 domain-containing protein n=1 Tax=Anisodus acutangulus TaxID=402998 RepID=A0A9Q1LNL8_9SOLA|nr:hypothetical protein K7X08_026298 [Anisodus acutangulus]